MDRIDNPAQFLIDNGILFEINRQVLHPLGLQLEVRYDDEGDPKGIDVLDNRASEHPIYFTAEEWEEGRAKYEAYLDAAGRRNMQKRRRMGMVIQTSAMTHVERAERKESED